MLNIKYDDLLNDYEDLNNTSCINQEEGELIVDNDNTLLKKKRKRNKKNKNKNPANKNCSVREERDYANTGNLIIKEINENKIFIAKIKEKIFNTNEYLFIKGRENPTTQLDPSIPNISFWQQRYYYFSKFDMGIKLDHESWYSVTPEEISEYIAESTKDKTVVDAFCGSGGNTIQFSKICKKVYAIDIDENKIELCKNNANIYEVEEDKIEFINSDYLQIKDIKDIDVVFLSPPWGGCDYKSCGNNYLLKEWVTPDIHKIIETSLKLSKNLILYLPRNTQIDELFQIISECQEDSEDEIIFAEIQMLVSANKVKALLIYFGEDYNKISIRDIRNYITQVYKGIQNYQLCQLVNLAKIMGASDFFASEIRYRKSIELNQEKDFSSKYISKFIKYIKEEVLSPEDLKEYVKIDNKNKKDAKCQNDSQKLIVEKLPLISEKQTVNNFNILKSNII